MRYKRRQIRRIFICRGTDYDEYHQIEGFKYQIDVRFKATEALEMIGMKMPK